MERGDRVMIFGNNTVETVASLWAALKANATVCVVNPMTKGDKLRYLLEDCWPTAFISRNISFRRNSRNPYATATFMRWRSCPGVAGEP